MERLQKYLARAGVASRRHAEELILQGRVAVNHRVVTELGTKIDPEADVVAVDGKTVEAAARSYVILYKPPGVVTTLEDPQGRPTVAHLTRALGPRLFPVGRLDFDAEGALLLTNDGELAHRLMHPRYQVPRTYLAKVKGVPPEEALEKLRGGVRLEDGMAKPLSVEVFERADKNTWLKLVVGEGRHHLVKRLCAAVGFPVVRLFRPSHGGIGVEGLRPGEARALTAEEVRRLEAMARGEAVPEPPLRLPARRHGRASEREEERQVSPGRAPRQAQGERRPRKGSVRPGRGARRPR